MPTRILIAYVLQNPIGKVFSESMFKLGPREGRIPDVLLLLNERLAAQDRAGFLTGAPELAFEVVSSESAAFLERKISLFLVNGCRHVLDCLSVRAIDTHSPIYRGTPISCAKANISKSRTCCPDFASWWTGSLTESDDRSPKTISRSSRVAHSCARRLHGAVAPGQHDGRRLRRRAPGEPHRLRHENPSRRSRGDSPEVSRSRLRHHRDQYVQRHATGSRRIPRWQRSLRAQQSGGGVGASGGGRILDTSAKPRWVAGSMGPTTRAISVTGGITFDELRQNYYGQARALLDGGVDILLLETCNDTRSVKAGLLAIERLLRRARRADSHHALGHDRADGHACSPDRAPMRSGLPSSTPIWSRSDSTAAPVRNS